MRGQSLKTFLSKSQKGSFTVEAACLFPLIAMVFVFCVWGVFYYHDKNIISSCAYETAVIGSTKAREKEGVTEPVLEAAFQERIQGKCILFPWVRPAVQIGENEIVVKAEASRGFMKVSTTHTSAITEPETFIRNLKRLE